MAYEIDENGNVVWRGPGPNPNISLPRAFSGATPEEQAAYLEQQRVLQAPKPDLGPQLPSYAADLPRSQQEAILREQYRLAGVPYPEVSPLGGPLGSPGLREPGNAPRLPDSSAPLVPLDLSGIFADTGPTGYSPSLVDTAAAEALLRYEQTPEEQAALEQLLQDLEFRAEAGIAAVRSGWEGVRAINQAAFNKAAQMARDAGPEAARLWLDAVDTVRNLSAQAAEFLATTPGMQRVNISPSAGSERIAALLAAQAPRAQALAERMGLASAEEIAAQGRTAAMMGEAYAGDIVRTALIQANQARQAHNASVLDRVAGQRELGAQMRFNAAQTNAQLLSQAAAQVTSGATSEEQRRSRVRNLVSDVREFANIDAQDAEPRNGIAALMGIYGLDADTARGLIMGAREGTLNWAALMAEIEG